MSPKAEVLGCDLGTIMLVKGIGVFPTMLHVRDCMIARGMVVEMLLESNKVWKRSKG